MKLIPWVLLVAGIIIFFEAPDALIGWCGVILSVGAVSYLIYKWGQNSGYWPEYDGPPRHVP